MQKDVAIKKAKPEAADDALDALAELEVMLTLRGHSCIMPLVDVVACPKLGLVFPKMGSSLSEFMRLCTQNLS